MEGAGLTRQPEAGAEVAEALAAGAGERLALALEQAGLYRLVGRCLEEELDAALLALLRGRLRAPLAAAGLKLDAHFVTAPAERLLEELAEEYTGLFIAPGGVCPYASVAETGCMFQAPADRALQAYREAGWDYHRCRSGEFPDHIGTMLAFVGELSAAEARALEQNDLDRAEHWAARRRSFLLEELGPWGPGLCRRGAGAALHGFYRALLELVEQVLWTELRAVADRRRFRELVELNRREPPRIDYNADFRKASGV